MNHLRLYGELGLLFLAALAGAALAGASLARRFHLPKVTAPLLVKKAVVSAGDLLHVLHVTGHPSLDDEKRTSHSEGDDERGIAS